MIDFSVNTNPFGPPKSLLKVLQDNVNIIAEYPDYLNKEILSILRIFLEVPTKNIALGVGSTQIIFDIPKFIPYRRAVVVVPTFWEYTIFNKVFKKDIKKIHLHAKDAFAPNYKTIQDTLQHGDCVFICNINNPTSVLYDRKELLKLVKNNPDVQFVVDETYLLFRSDFSTQSLVKDATRRNNLHVVMSFSKFFSIPGARLGVIVSGRSIIKEHNTKYHIPYSMSPFSALALKHLITKSDFVSRSRAFYGKESSRLFSILKKEFENQLECFMPNGCFILVKIVNGQKSEELKSMLERRGILVRGGHEILDMTNQWLRFSIQSRKNNDFLVGELKKVLKD